VSVGGRRRYLSTVGAVRSTVVSRSRGRPPAASRDQFLDATIGLALVAPGNSVQDINDSGDGQLLSGERLWPQTKAIRPADLGLEFSIPFFVFQGEEDFTTSTALARQYLESIKAPRKEFVAIKGGGHFAVFMRSDQFLEELVTRVRPLALGH